MSRRVDTKRSSAVLVYLLLLISLQVFLLVVAVEGLLEGDAGLAWPAALFSAALFATAVAFSRLLSDA